MVMGMARNCQNCTEKCPQAERANQAALGRMYATKEFTALLKKGEIGELVEVVRCKDCEHRVYVDMGDEIGEIGGCKLFKMAMPYDNFCSYGKRKDNETL